MNVEALAALYVRRSTDIAATFPDLGDCIGAGFAELARTQDRDKADRLHLLLGGAMREVAHFIDAKSREART